MNTAKPRPAHSALVASLAAGPLFVLMIGLLAVATSSRPIAVDPTIVDAIVGLPLVIVFGFMLALLPNLLGSALLDTLARHHEGWRLPVIWGLVGAAGGYAATWIGGTAPDPLVAAALSLTGAGCALICRRGHARP